MEAIETRRKRCRWTAPARRLAAAALVAATAGLGTRQRAEAGMAPQGEFEITAASFTVDNQINLAKATYYGTLVSPPTVPSAATQLTTPGGLWFDGTRYQVWDAPSGVWVSLATATAAGLLPWSELSAFPPACSAGQFVTALGAAPTCSASGTLSGGSAGYYGKWTGASSLGLGSLFDDGAGVTLINASTLTVQGSAFSVGGSTLAVVGGSVGVGTNAPVGKLQVLGNAIIGNPVGTADQADRSLQIGARPSNAGLASLGFDVGGTFRGDWDFDGTTGDMTYWGFNGATWGSKVAIKDSGNLGIGTTSPASTMTVAGSIGLTGVGAPPVAPAGTGRLYFDSGVNKLKLSENGGAYVNLIGGAGGAVTLQAATPGVADSGHLNITGTGLFGGNVGIGTASPTSLLSVEGSVPGSYVGAYVKNTGGNAAATLSRFSVGQTNAESVALLLQFDHNTDNALVLNRKLGTGTLDLQTTGGGLHISNAGNTGIGTTSPVTALDVNGGETIRSSSTWVGTSTPVVPPSAQGALYYDSGLKQFMVSQNGASFTALGTANSGGGWTRAAPVLAPANASDNVVIQSTLTVQGNAFSVGGSTLVAVSGSVGIGTTAPATNLEVDGNNYGGGGAQSFALFVSTNQSHGAVAPGLGFGGTNGVATIQTYANAALTINPNGGNVGIGTAGPDTPLQVFGGSGNLLKLQSSTLMGTAGQVMRIPFVQNTNVEVSRIEANTEASGQIGLGFYTYNSGLSPSQNLYIKSNGNVGVGTTNPGARLQTECDGGGNCIRIHGIGNYEPVLDLSSSTPNTGLQVLRETSLANFWAVKTVTPGLSLGLFTDNTASHGIYIQTGGNVGIGTTGPDAKLTVNGSGSEGTLVAHITHGGVADIALFYEVAAYSPNGAAAALKLGQNSVTGRSINAGGTINASGADYAEWILWPGKKPAPGTIVAYKGAFLVVSSTRTAAFVGNDKFDASEAILVSFAGQLPVKVRGPVKEGDYILPGPNGAGFAVAAERATFDQYRRAVGIAWETNLEEGTRNVLVAVGLK